MSETRRNPPLVINAHIYDIKTDVKENTRIFNIRRASFNRELPNSAMLKDFEKQKEIVDSKKQSMINLIIWAANNGKSVEFISMGDDQDEDD